MTKHVTDAALRRDGVIDAKADQYAAASRVPISEHVEAHIAYSANAGRAPRRVSQVRRHLETMIDAVDMSGSGT